MMYHNCLIDIIYYILDQGMLIGQLWLTQSQKCDILAIIVPNNNTFYFWAVHMGHVANVQNFWTR